MSALRFDKVAGAAGIEQAPDRSDYDDSRALTDMAIDSDDSRLTRFERRDDR